MSAEEKWQSFGASMGDVIGYIVIYFIVLGGVFSATIVVALLYAAPRLSIHLRVNLFLKQSPFIKGVFR